MKRNFSTIVISTIVLFFTACTTENKQEDASVLSNVLRINESAPYRTLYPPAAKDIVSIHLISQIYEGLVKYNPEDLSVEPAIAKSWDIDSSGTIYTFYLNDNVYFQDDSCFAGGKGRKVTAADFKYTFELLCTKDDDNTSFYGTLDKVEGAKEYYENNGERDDKAGIDGIKVIDDYTLQIQLVSEHPLLVYFLSNPQAVVLPHEAVEKYGTDCHIGCGPYFLAKKQGQDEVITLLKNPNYYKKDKDGKQLPYIDSVCVSFVGAAQRELNMFEEGKLDIITGMSGESVTEFMDKHMKDFEKNPPVFVLNQSEEDVESDIFNIEYSYVHNFFTNRMNYLDLSEVYFVQPKKIDREELKEQMQVNR